MNSFISRRSLMRAAAAVPVVVAASAVGGVVTAPTAGAAAVHDRTLRIDASGRPGKPVVIPQRVVAEHQPGATADSVSISTVVNLGLSKAEAINVQVWLTRYWGYTGAWDGLLGTNSWKAFQRCLKSYWGYTGAIDGIVGSGTISALQRLLRHYGYTGAIDGIAGSGTRAAFRRFAS